MQDNNGAFGVSPSLPEALLLSRNGTALTQDSTTGELSIWRNGEETPLADLCGRAGELFVEGYLLEPVDMNDSGALLVQAMDEHNEGPVGLLLPIDIVPDYDRDGAIDAEDWGKVTETDPWRWWINDDVDESEGHWEGPDIPGQPNGDHTDLVVNGRRDLVDFFAARIPVPSKPWKALIDQGWDIRLAHSDEAINMTMTFLPISSIENLNRRGFGTSSLWTQAVQTLTPAGVSINSVLERMATVAEDQGFFLFEAIAVTNEPIELVILDDEDVEVARIPVVELKTSDVEDMYRHLNVRDSAEILAYNGSVPNLVVGPITTTMGIPSNWSEDEDAAIEYLAFVHGFNVDEQAARGWNAEMFKRMYALGSNASFIGLSWFGNPQLPQQAICPDYHKAVFNAFLTGRDIADQFGFVNRAKGDTLSIAGHSLGNMVVSSALALGNGAGTKLTAEHYFLVNAAVALEAYDGEQTPGTPGAGDNSTRPVDPMQHWMRHDDFKAYPERIDASNWHQVFAETDNRRKITWRGLFEDVAPIAWNFYSTGEDVVENPESGETVPLNLLFMIKGVMTPRQGGRHAWVAQEISKGTPLNVLQSMYYKNQGGWAFNEKPIDLTLIGAPVDLDGDGTIDDWEVADPSLADSLSSGGLGEERIAQFGFFKKFDNENLYGPIEVDLRPGGPSQALSSGLAADPLLRYELLATAIPASSFAAAANSVDSFGAVNFARNIDMMDQKAGGWDAGPEDPTGFWRHNDIKNMSIQYTHEVFEEMINIGNLK